MLGLILQPIVAHSLALLRMEESIGVHVGITLGVVGERP